MLPSRSKKYMLVMSFLRCAAEAVALHSLKISRVAPPGCSYTFIAITSVRPQNDYQRPICHSSFSTRKSRIRLYSNSPENKNEHKPELPMENLYTEWSLEQDKILWENRSEPTTKLAALLGRGLRGVEARLSKLKDVNSPAYERLFAKKSKKERKQDTLDNNMDVGKKAKLVPVSEVLRRIQWDYSLSEECFSLLHYDRVDDKVVESRLDAPNNSISGTSTSLVDALPEHRILAVKYKERIVWDREKKYDRVFSEGGIEEVIETYDEWKRKKDADEQWLGRRQMQMAHTVSQILGLDRYARFKSMSTDLQSTLENSSVSAKNEAEKYVELALGLFREAREDPISSLEPALIPRSDLEALDCLSELVALSPQAQLRNHVLKELSIVLDRLEGRPNPASTTDPFQRELPEVSEEDITETFVRGSGPGGQKINKTNNKVLLIHNPTKLRVECQETRSLQQNRKIARRRLRLKLDEFIHGSQSRTSVKAEKAASKKQKLKARARARNRKKTAAEEGKGANQAGDQAKFLRNE